MESVMLDLFSCCVPRDVFGLQTSADKDVVESNLPHFKVNKFVNFCSPLFLQDGLSITLDKLRSYLYGEDAVEDEIPQLGKFYLRCFYLELSKKIFEYFKANESDYLIVDNGFVYYEYLKLENNTIIIENFYKPQIMPLIEHGVLPKIIEKFDIMKFSDKEIEERIQLFCSEVLKLYKSEQIILFDLKAAILSYDHVLNKWEVFNYEYLKKLERYYQLTFNCLKKFFKDCHVISLPYPMIGNANHKWGPCSLHFNTSCYNYLYKCMEIVTQNLSREQEVAELNKLIKDFTYLEQEIYYPKLVDEYARYLAQRYSTCSLNDIDFEVDGLYIQVGEINNRLLIVDNVKETNFNNLYQVSCAFFEKQLYLYFSIQNSVFFIGDIFSDGGARISKCQHFFDCEVYSIDENNLKVKLNTRFGWFFKQDKILSCIKDKNDATCFTLLRK